MLCVCVWVASLYDAQPEVYNDTMKICPDQFKLFEYAENELTAQEARLIARHLETCEACRHNVAAMRISHDVLASVAPIAPPDYLMQAISGAIGIRAEGITCSSAHELVSACIDGELTAEQTVLLDAHLQDCADCRYFSERMGLLTSALRAVPDVAPLPGLKARIEAAVDRAAGVGNIFQRKLPRRIASFAGIAAAAALFFAVVFNFAPISGVAVVDQPTSHTIAAAPVSHADTPATQRVPQPTPATAAARNANGFTKPDVMVAKAVSDAPTQNNSVSYHATIHTANISQPPHDASTYAPAPAIPPTVQPAAPVAISMRPQLSTAPIEIRPSASTETPAAPRHTAVTGQNAATTTRNSVPVPAPSEVRPPQIERTTIAKATPDINVQLPSIEKKTSFVPMRVASAAMSEAPMHIVKTSYVPVREEPAHSVALSSNSLASHLAASRDRVSKKADAMASSVTDGKIVIIR